MHILTILLAFFWFFVVTGTGAFFLKRTNPDDLRNPELPFLSFGTGLVFVGYSVFVLGAVGLYRPVALTLLMAFLFILAVIGWQRMSMGLFFVSHQSIKKSLFAQKRTFLLLALIIPLGVIGLLLVLTPEIGRDALSYHLAVPKLYLKHGGIHFIDGNIAAAYPQLAEMHYLLALFLQDDILAKAMQFTILGATLWGIILLTRTVGADLSSALWAVLIFLSVPSVFRVSHTAYSDLFVAFFTLAAFLCFLGWAQNRSDVRLILAGVFTGAAVACKYTTLIIIPLGCLGVLVFSVVNKTPSLKALRDLFLYGAVTTALGSPFYLKNWFFTGNPFYPFFFGVFGGRGLDADQARLLDLFVQNFGMGRRWIDYLLLPWNLSFRAAFDSVAFDGVIGPVFLFTLPFAVGLYRNAAALSILIFSFVSFLFWASSAQEIRFLIPVLGLLSAVIGAMATFYRKRKAVYFFLVGVIITGFAYNAYSIIVHDFMKIKPLRYVAGLESREDFLSRLIPVYPMYRFADQNLPDRANIFLVYMKNYTFFCKQDCYSDSLFEAHMLGKMLREASSAKEFFEMIQQRGFTHIMYDERYLTGDWSPLSPEEKNKFVDCQTRFLFLLKRIGPYGLYRLSADTKHIPHQNRPFSSLFLSASTHRRRCQA